MCSIHHHRKKSNAAPSRRFRQRWRRRRWWRKKGDLTSRSTTNLPIYNFDALAAGLLLLFFHHQKYFFYVFATFACISLSGAHSFSSPCQRRTNSCVLFFLFSRSLSLSLAHRYKLAHLKCEAFPMEKEKKTKGDESNPKKDQPKEWKEWAKYCAVFHSFE